MKIAIIANDISRSAGTERAVSNLANILSTQAENSAYEVYLISVFTSIEQSYYQLNDNINIIHLNATHIRNNIHAISHYWGLVRSLRKVVAENGIDILIGTTHAINIILPFTKAGKRLKVIGCEHLAFFAAIPLVRKIRGFMYRYLDKVVVLTKRDAQNYKDAAIIPNSLSFFPREHATLDNKRILAVGRYLPQKGFDLLIESASIFLKDNKDWKVSIIGQGEQESLLLSLITKYKLNGNVELCPPTKMIMNEFLNSSIYVMSSRFEGLPMVLLEAKACGLPCVSFDCPEGPAEIIKNDRDGYVVENGNLHLLAEKVKELMNDEEKRREMGYAARMDAENYSEKKVYSMWDSLIKSLQQQ